MPDFYTIGLPRTRSLWLSKLLSYGDSTCFHEHLSQHDRERRYDVDTKYRGFCDTNPLIKVDYGNSPVVIVKRNREDVINSALRCFDRPEGVMSFRGFLENYICEYENALNELSPKHSMVISYEDLDSMDTLKQICDFLMPGNIVPEDYIVEMMGLRIQTTNRNLTASLKHTTDSIGVDYNEFIARYDIPTYTCQRIWNHQLVTETMSSMWDEISEDDAPPYLPDLINEQYIGVWNDDDYIGMYRFHQHTSVMWEGHAFILEDKREHAVGSGNAIKAWIKENLKDAKKIIANVPECFQNVIGFLKGLGFVEQGVNSDSYNKNGLVAVYQLGMKVEDM